MIKFLKTGIDNASLTTFIEKPCIQMADTQNYNALVGPVIKIAAFTIFITFDDRQSNGIVDTAPIMLWKSTIDINDSYQFYMKRTYGDNRYEIGLKGLHSETIIIHGASDTYAILGIQVRIINDELTFKYITKKLLVSTTTFTIPQVNSIYLLDATSSVTLNAMSADNNNIIPGKSRYYNIQIYNRIYLDADMINAVNILLTTMATSGKLLFRLDASDNSTLFSNITKTTRCSVLSYVLAWTVTNDLNANDAKHTGLLGSNVSNNVTLSPVCWNKKNVTNWNRDCLLLDNPELTNNFTEGTIIIVATKGSDCVSPLNCSIFSIYGNKFDNIITDDFGLNSQEIVYQVIPSGPMIYIAVANELTNNVKFYINNILSPINTLAPFSGFTTKKYTIGGHGNNPNYTSSNGFNGYLAEIRYYNIPLTESSSITLSSVYNEINNKWGINNFVFRCSVNTLLKCEDSTGKALTYNGSGITMYNDSVFRGYVLNNNGTSSISTTDKFMFGPSYTKMCWVRFTNTTKTIFIGNSEMVPPNQVSGYGHAFGMNYGSLAFKHGTNSNSIGTFTNARIPNINTWYHIAMTYDNDTTNAYAYVNAAQSNLSSSQLYRWEGMVSSINIMGHQITNSLLNGMMDNIYITNRVLTQREIQEHMNITIVNSFMLIKNIYIFRQTEFANLSVGSVKIYNRSNRILATAGQLKERINGVWSDLNGDGLSQKITVSNSRNAAIQLELPDNTQVTHIVIMPAVGFANELLNSSVTLSNNNGEVIRNVNGLTAESNTIYSGGPV